MRLQLTATATFGLEAVVKREIQALGYEIITTENGKVYFWGDERAIVRGNLWLRCADRLLLCMGKFHAETFEELFQQTKGIAWEELIPVDGKFTVIGTSARSTLHSVPACQSIVKKAIVERLKDFYCIEQFPETGAEYTVKITMLKDEALLTVDTSGVALHKRGYRVCDVTAPIKETLAAALVQLSFWRTGRLLVDPCCGSGTIPIEAALIGRNIAPGLSRSFASEEWELIPREYWKEERAEAFAAIDAEADVQILASDIDGKVLAGARENAMEAGVDDCIDFRRMDIAGMEERITEACGAADGLVVLSNFPYARRIGDEKGLRHIYHVVKDLMKKHRTWSFFLITADKELERSLGRKADRRRKLYNGNIETTYYQFHGAKS